jgi:hypothetical protein
MITQNMIPGIVPSVSVVRRASLKIHPEAAPFWHPESVNLFLQC